MDNCGSSIPASRLWSAVLHFLEGRRLILEGLKVVHPRAMIDFAAQRLLGENHAAFPKRTKLCQSRIRVRPL